MDGINQWGKTSDFTVIGLGNSTLDDAARRALKAHNRTVRPDAEPEKGFYYRSDHFEFAKQGVPAMDVDAGTEYIGKPAGYGKQKRDEYTNNDYHKPSDEVKADWDLSGGVQDVQTLFKVGYQRRAGEGDSAVEAGDRIQGEAGLDDGGENRRAEGRGVEEAVIGERRRVFEALDRANPIAYGTDGFSG